ncbi:DUF5615 family PIN-like protein [Rhodococcus kronopolitis]|uniref:DUF5615 family PIN-like protein n=1 Tax=Rhodococcus kronopolitis TaxID=1460226 RepID=A0ABV9FZK9_9NOCA
MQQSRRSPLATRVAVGCAVVAGAALVASPVAAAVRLSAPDEGAQQGYSDEISSKYDAFGGASTPLGKPVGDAYVISGGVGQDYEGGAIYYSAETGAHVLYGDILARYREAGGPAVLGFPTVDETDALAGADRFSDFSGPDGATGYWTPEGGAWLVRGPILAAWNHLGGAEGPLGAPIAAETEVDGVREMRFGGAEGTASIRYSAADGYVVVPAELAGRLDGLQDTGTSAARVPTGDVVETLADVDAVVADEGPEGDRSWLGWVVAAVVAGSAGLFLLWGRRGAAAAGPLAPTTPAVPAVPTVPAVPAPVVEETEAAADPEAAPAGEPVRQPLPGGAGLALAGGLAAAGVGAGALAWLHRAGEAGAPDTELDARLSGLDGADDLDVAYPDLITGIPSAAVAGLALLIDENLSTRVAAQLRDAGYDAVHLYSADLRGADRTRVLACAAAEGRVLVTAEVGYVDDLIEAESGPSVLLLRRPDAAVDEQVSVLLASFPHIAQAFDPGALVVLGAERIRVRAFPIGGS